MSADTQGSASTLGRKADPRTLIQPVRGSTICPPARRPRVARQDARCGPRRAVAARPARRDADALRTPVGGRATNADTTASGARAGSTSFGSVPGASSAASSPGLLTTIRHHVENYSNGEWSTPIPTNTSARCVRRATTARRHAINLVDGIEGNREQSMASHLRRHQTRVARARSRNERNERPHWETVPIDPYDDMESLYQTLPIPLGYGTPPMARRIPPGVIYDTVPIAKRISIIGWKFTAYVAFTAIGSIVIGLLVIGGMALAWKYA